MAEVARCVERSQVMQLNLLLAPLVTAHPHVRRFKPYRLAEDAPPRASDPLEAKDALASLGIDVREE